MFLSRFFGRRKQSSVPSPAAEVPVSIEDMMAVEVSDDGDSDMSAFLSMSLGTVEQFVAENTDSQEVESGEVNGKYLSVKTDAGSTVGLLYLSGQPVIVADGESLRKSTQCLDFVYSDQEVIEHDREIFTGHNLDFLLKVDSVSETVGLDVVSRVLSALSLMSDEVMERHKKESVVEKWMMWLSEGAMSAVNASSLYSLCSSSVESKMREVVWSYDSPIDMSTFAAVNADSREIFTYPMVAVHHILTQHGDMKGVDVMLNAEEYGVTFYESSQALADLVGNRNVTVNGEFLSTVSTAEDSDSIVNVPEGAEDAAAGAVSLSAGVSDEGGVLGTDDENGAAEGAVGVFAADANVSAADALRVDDNTDHSDVFGAVKKGKEETDSDLPSLSDTDASTPLKEGAAFSAAEDEELPELDEFLPTLKQESSFSLDGSLSPWSDRDFVGSDGDEFMSLDGLSSDGGVSVQEVFSFPLKPTLQSTGVSEDVWGASFEQLLVLDAAMRNIDKCVAVAKQNYQDSVKELHEFTNIRGLMEKNPEMVAANKDKETALYDSSMDAFYALEKEERKRYEVSKSWLSLHDVLISELTAEGYEPHGVFADMVAARQEWVRSFVNEAFESEEEKRALMEASGDFDFSGSYTPLYDSIARIIRVV